MKPLRPIPLCQIPLLLGLSLPIATLASAQWSDDPSSNLVLADAAGEQVQPKLVPTPDGGVYVSWFDNETGGYDVTLQRLDKYGVELWVHNGVLILDRGFSSTQDYGLGIDSSGNALLAYRDDTGSGIQITAQAVNPNGTLLWGADGVQLTNTSDFVAAPKIVGTTDGHVVVAWTQDVNVVAQKLDLAGAPVWPAPVTLVPQSGSFSVSDLQAAEAGTAIVAFVHAGSPSPRHLWAQKLGAADGASAWGAGHVQVYDDGAGSLQFGNFPTFLPDGAGGAVFAWYTSSPSLQVRAQHILANGSEAFAHNGVEASTNGSQLRVSPALGWSSGSSEIFLFWTELNALQSQFGVYGQKLDGGGIRQWGEEGKVLLPLGSQEITQVRTLASGEGALAIWAETLAIGNQPIRAMGVDGAGDPSWTPTVTDLDTRATATSRLASTESASGFAIFVWQDGATDANLLAQALSPDGSLGSGAIFSDGFESGSTGSWSNVVP